MKKLRLQLKKSSNELELVPLHSMYGHYGTEFLDSLIKSNSMNPEYEYKITQDINVVLDTEDYYFILNDREHLKDKFSDHNKSAHGLLYNKNTVVFIPHSIMPYKVSPTALNKIFTDYGLLPVFIQESMTDSQKEDLIQDIDELLSRFTYYGHEIDGYNYSYTEPSEVRIAGTEQHDVLDKLILAKDRIIPKSKSIYQGTFLYTPPFKSWRDIVNSIETKKEFIEFIDTLELLVNGEFIEDILNAWSYLELPVTKVFWWYIGYLMIDRNRRPNYYDHSSIKDSTRNYFGTQSIHIALTLRDGTRVLEGSRGNHNHAGWREHLEELMSDQGALLEADRYLQEFDTNFEEVYTMKNFSVSQASIANTLKEKTPLVWEVLKEV